MSEIAQFLVYGLRDPRTGEIRYVGLSRRGMSRPLEHMFPAELKKTHTYKQRWVQALIQKHGIVPEIVVLQQFPTEEGLCEAERWWIAQGRAALGPRFANECSGGEGFTGQHRPESKELIRASAKQRMVDLEFRQKSLDALARREFTPEYRAKLSAKAKARDNTVNLQKMWDANRGRVHTPEECAKVSIALKGRKRTPEHVASSRAGMAAYIAAHGGLHSAETRKKIGAKARGRKDTPETGAKRVAAQKARREREALAKVAD